MNSVGSPKALILEPRLDYLLELPRLGATQLTISSMLKRSSPVYLRTNVTNTTGPAGEVYGLELYWSFSFSRPNYDTNDGAVHLGQSCQIASQNDDTTFPHRHLHLTLFSFQQCRIRIGFDFGQDFFAGGQLL